MINYKEKKCSICNKTYKPTSGVQIYCIDCGVIIKNKLRKIHNKKYRNTHKEKIEQNRREYYNKNKRHLSIISRNWKIKNRDIINKKNRDRCKTDNLYRLKRNCSTLIRNVLKNKKNKKISCTTIYLDCSIEFLRGHLESQFKSWMNWNNYGKYNGELNYGWDIDHIIPLSSAKTEEELIKLFHYTNLQPLDSYVNRNIKKDKYVKNKK